MSAYSAYKPVECSCWIISLDECARWIVSLGECSRWIMSKGECVHGLWARVSTYLAYWEIVAWVWIRRLTRIIKFVRLISWISRVSHISQKCVIADVWQSYTLSTSRQTKHAEYFSVASGNRHITATEEGDRRAACWWDILWHWGYARS